VNLELELLGDFSDQLLASSGDRAVVRLKSANSFLIAA